MHWPWFSPTKTPPYPTTFVPPPTTEIPDPPAPPQRYRSNIDRDALILAELREIKTLLRLIKDRM